MSTQISYTPGSPATFVATKTFVLGTSGITLQKGMKVLFDGSQVTAEGHHPFTMPSFRGAIKTNWVVPIEVYDESVEDRPVSAGIKIRKADGGNPMDHQPKEAAVTVDAEETDVMDTQAHAQRTRDRNSKAGRNAGQRSDSMEVQDGTVVSTARIQTPAKQTTSLDHAGEAIHRANSLKIRPGEGRTREEALESMSEEEQAEYLASLESRKAAYVDEAPIVGKVAAPRVVEQDGFTITNSIGKGSSPQLGGEEAGTIIGRVAAPKSVEQDGFSITNSVGTKPAPKTAAKKVAKPISQAVADTRRKIAKAVCPDFPDNYVFTDSPKKKLARLQADYDGNWPVIRAVAAAETDDDFKALLVEEFPEAFE